MSRVSASAHDELDDVRLASALAESWMRRVETSPTVVSIFDAMAGSRLLDIEARRMRDRGQGFYTIGSAGHEWNAIVAAASPAHRSRPVALPLGRLLPGPLVQAGRPLEDGLRDILLGLAAATSRSRRGWRHKVFGNPELAIIPQTSTIASHLPRAVGVAFAIDRARRLGA